jgi:hypothetical protein
VVVIIGLYRAPPTVARDMTGADAVSAELRQIAGTVFVRVNQLATGATKKSLVGGSG